VSGYYRWLDWLRQQATLFGKEPVFINLDETAVSCSWPQVRGNVVKPRLWFRKRRGPFAKSKLKTIRTAVTHVALITHRSDVQAVLPQIFIGNEVAFPLDALESCQKPPTVQFWRNKSSWNSVALMQRVVREVRAALHAFPNIQPILIMDAAPIHLHPRVLEQGMKSDIWMACVPAGLTWLLQPLDTHAFSLYKAWLRNEFRVERSAGPVSVQQWLDLLCRGATTFLCGRRWHRAFEADGIIGLRRTLSDSLRDHYALTDAGTPEAVPPTEQELQVLLPRGRKPHRTLWVFKPSGRKRYLFLVWDAKKKEKRTAKKSHAKTAGATGSSG